MQNGELDGWREQSEVDTGQERAQPHILYDMPAPLTRVASSLSYIRLGNPLFVSVLARPV